ncbi:HD domain-containing protein [Undibacterium sp. TJN19]|uniref:HD domain-containing protein n=1 Tax=Undibacterium sp. TJN19 TaxID=3413055 RepID=UPI003BEF85BA
MKLITIVSVYGIVFGLSFFCNTANADNNIPSDWRANVIEFSKKNFKHPAWGFSHSMRDYNLAKSLALQDKVTIDDDVLFAAAYLHDIAAFPHWEKEGINHADQGAAIVDTILNGSGFPVEKIETVRHAIKTHMFNRDPVGVESVYLHDADALDWLGAIGIVRILSMIEHNGEQPDSHKIVGMLENYTYNVPNHVISPAGQLLAVERKADSMRYLQQLKSETANLNSL